jgi:hypothetical protein
MGRSGQPAPTTRLDEEVRALSEAEWRWSVDGRFDELADLFDDDLVFVHLTGHISPRQEWIGLRCLGSPPPRRSQAIGDRLASGTHPSDARRGHGRWT